MLHLNDFQRKKIKSYIGFSLKARKILLGTDAILKKKQFELVIIDNELSQNARDKIIKHCEEKKYILVDNLSELSSKAGCKALALLDAELAKTVINSVNTHKE
jgi:ribosomal protein L7Ae-like RNA K-turn-binding protein